MDKKTVIEELRKLAKSIGRDTVLQKDIRTVPKLDYYLMFYFRNLGTALKEAGLSSSPLASKMIITNEQLLEYLRKLKEKNGKIPNILDITHDDKVYKEFSDKKFSWRIFKTRFGGIRDALKRLDNSAVYADEVKSENAEIEKDNPEFFQNKNRFFGKAAELHVTAELMYRGFQAANIPVDEGLDVLAVKSNKTFYFQVKHKDLNSSERIHITKSSFEKRGGGDVYYIFVLLSDEVRNFLIIPYHIINDWIRAGLAEEGEKGYSFLIKKVDGEYKLKDVGLNKYLNRWEDIK